MLLDVAGRVGRASGVGAGVDAPVVPAGLIGRAAAVPQADRQGRIAVANADADGLVVQDLAALVLGTGRLGAHVARVLALAIDAGGVGRTVKVLVAGRRIRGAGELAQFVNDEAVLADAHGLMVPDLAALVHLAAVLEVGAGIAAFPGLSVAGQPGRAVAVRGAADAGHRGPGTDRVALGVRVAGRLRHADVALGTGAAGLVQDDPAKGVDATGAS